jgi:magnesium transporter
MPALPKTPLSSIRPGLLSSRRPGRDNLLPKLRVPMSAYVVDCGVYVDGKRLAGRFTHDQAINEVRRRGEGFVWIGLHELAVEDAVTAKQRPKLERYEDSLFMVLKTVTYVEHDEPTTATELIKTGEVMAFVGPDFIVTVRHGDHCGLHHVREKLEGDPEQLALGPAAVLHAIADHVVDRYVTVTDAIEKDIDEIEAEVFEPRSAMDSEQIYVMKREVMELRRSVAPLVTPLRKLTEGYSSLVPHEVRSYFRDVDDHLSTVTERVTGFDELLTTLVDAVLAKITMRQNNDMRKITAYAGLISVPTMVAGIYGMNFDFMPELHWRFGYPLALMVTGLVCLLLYRNFRRNRWL